MPSQVIIYHNQRCSKSRQTVELLRGHGVEPRIIEYLRTPLSENEIAALLEKLDRAPLDLVRTSEEAFAASGLTEMSGATEVARAIAERPILLQRPVVVKGQRAAIGCPPENVLAIL
jgi:arsenate reductase